MCLYDRVSSTSMSIIEKAAPPLFHQIDSSTVWVRSQYFGNIHFVWLTGKPIYHIYITLCRSIAAVLHEFLKFICAKCPEHWSLQTLCVNHGISSTVGLRLNVPYKDRLSLSHFQGEFLIPFWKQDVQKLIWEANATIPFSLLFLVVCR